MSKTIYHDHHIIPKYRCKELGIDPDLPENIVRLTRKEHANAHYQLWLENKDPRDLVAAQLIAKGEIERMIDNSFMLVVEKMPKKAQTSILLKL